MPSFMGSHCASLKRTLVSTRYHLPLWRELDLGGYPAKVTEDSQHRNLRIGPCSSNQRYPKRQTRNGECLRESFRAGSTIPSESYIVTLAESHYEESLSRSKNLTISGYKHYLRQPPAVHPLLKRSGDGISSTKRCSRDYVGQNRRKI